MCSNACQTYLELQFLELIGNRRCNNETFMNPVTCCDWSSCEIKQLQLGTIFIMSFRVMILVIVHFMQSGSM